MGLGVGTYSRLGAYSRWALIPGRALIRSYLFFVDIYLSIYQKFLKSSNIPFLTVKDVTRLKQCVKSKRNLSVKYKKTTHLLNFTWPRPATLKQK